MHLFTLSMMELLIGILSHGPRASCHPTVGEDTTHPNTSLHYQQISLSKLGSDTGRESWKGDEQFSAEVLYECLFIYGLGFSDAVVRIWNVLNIQVEKWQV